MILYSDGLTECPNRDGDLLDENGLADLVGSGARQSGSDFTAHLLNALVKYAGTDDFPDDLSAVVIEKTSPDFPQRQLT